MISIRPPKNSEEIKQIEDIQQTVWRITPHNTLHAWLHAGGIVLCAFDEERMIGFVAGFMGEIGGKRLHWSHMLAVLPDYRRRGIGRQLKLAQREAALKQGLDLMGWTFDPLRLENALFNIEGLGATCCALHPEFYGTMSDNLNVGRLTDRLEVRWELNSERVIACAGGAALPPAEKPSDYVLRIVDNQPSLSLPNRANAPSYGAELPTQPETLPPWNYALREAAALLFRAGYSIERVLFAPEQPQTFTYVFQRPPAWYLYLLETADGTLYTGITTDLDKRLAAHNAGRGAKYTASRRPVKLLAAWETFGQGQAMRLEQEFKKLTRTQKQKLVASGADFKGTPRCR